MSDKGGSAQPLRSPPSGAKAMARHSATAKVEKSALAVALASTDSEHPKLRGTMGELGGPTIMPRGQRIGRIDPPRPSTRCVVLGAPHPRPPKSPREGACLTSPTRCASSSTAPEWRKSRLA
eukprot:941616-Pyramimonas_sp.AAC.1